MIFLLYEVGFLKGLRSCSNLNVTGVSFQNHHSVKRLEKPERCSPTEEKRLPVEPAVSPRPPTNHCGICTSCWHTLYICERRWYVPRIIWGSALKTKNYHTGVLIPCLPTKIHRNVSAWIPCLTSTGAFHLSGLLTFPCTALQPRLVRAGRGGKRVFFPQNSLNNSFFTLPSWLCCPLRFQNSPQTHRSEGFLAFGNLSFTTPSLGQVSVPTSFVFHLSFIFCPTSFQKEWTAFLSAWCPPPTFRSSFVEFAQHSNDLSMKLWGRKWSPRPILRPSQDCLNNSFLKKDVVFAFYVLVAFLFL